MHALFDEAGKFLAGRILSEAETSAQIELDSGKRVKAKGANILLKFDKPAPNELLAQAQAGTSAEFALAFTIDANRSLTITLHEVYLALAKTPIEGPAGVEASFAFRAAFTATATRMMPAVLRNQQAGTAYA